VKRVEGRDQNMSQMTNFVTNTRSEKKPEGGRKRLFGRKKKKKRDTCIRGQGTGTLGKNSAH